MSYGYRLSKENIETLPVSFYTASISVKAGAAGGSEVEWTGRFYRADTTNEPPEHLNDAAAVKAMSDFMRVGLQGIKDKAEGKSTQSRRNRRAGRGAGRCVANSAV